MKLLSKRGISVAPPAWKTSSTSLSAAPSASLAVPADSLAIPNAVSAAVSAVPAAVSAVSAVVPTVSVSASAVVPTVSASDVSVNSAVISATGLAFNAALTSDTTATLNTLIENAESHVSTPPAITTQRPSTPADEQDVTMESPPRPEGSSRATGGILRNRAMGQYYNPVDDEELHVASIIEKVKGVVKIYVSPLDPVELDFTKMQPSLKVPVIVNLNLGPVLKEVAVRWPPITRKLFMKCYVLNLMI